jgi:hypothetical protein
MAHAGKIRVSAIAVNNLGGRLADGASGRAGCLRAPGGDRERRSPSCGDGRGGLYPQNPQAGHMGVTILPN